MRRTRARLLPLFAALLILPFAGCRPDAEEEPVVDDLSTGTEIGFGTETPLPPVGGEATSATARLQGPDGTDMGEVTFTREGGGVRVEAHLTNVEGSGPHGFHVHENGACDPPSFESAGAHFNPTNAPHACPPTNPRHAGDLGNVEIDGEGNGHLELTTDMLSFSGQGSVIGKAVIVHSQVDDCTTQPSGDAGTRVACGVVQGGPGPLPGDDALGAEQGTAAPTM